MFLPRSSLAQCKGDKMGICLKLSGFFINGFVLKRNETEGRRV